MADDRDPDLRRIERLFRVPEYNRLPPPGPIREIREDEGFRVFAGRLMRVMQVNRAPGRPPGPQQEQPRVRLLQDPRLVGAQLPRRITTPRVPVADIPEVFPDHPRDPVVMKVTRAYNPAKFWHQAQDNTGAFKELEERMRIFYTDKDSPYSGPNFVIPEGIEKGGYYAFYSKIMRRWARCVCTSQEVEFHAIVEMTLVDFGCVESVPVTHVRRLLQSFSLLRAQGFMARLNNVDVQDWTGKTCMTFRECVLGKVYHVLVVKRHNRADTVPIVGVILGKHPEFHDLLVGWSANGLVTEPTENQRL